jgi:hypothetical protein
MRHTITALMSFWAGGCVALLGVVDSQARSFGASITPETLAHLAIWPYHLACYVWRILL